MDEIFLALVRVHSGSGSSPLPAGSVRAVEGLGARTPHSMRVFGQYTSRALGKAPTRSSQPGRCN